MCHNIKNLSQRGKNMERKIEVVKLGPIVKEDLYIKGGFINATW